jgi:hypothetical protein
MDEGRKIAVLFDKKTNAISLTFLALSIGCQLQDNFARKQYAIDEATIGQVVAAVGEQARLLLVDMLDKSKLMTPITMNIQLFDRPLVANYGMLGHLGGLNSGNFLNTLSLAFGLNKKYEPSEEGFIKFVEDTQNKIVDKPIHGFNFNYGMMNERDNATVYPPGIIVLQDVEDDIDDGKGTIVGKGNSSRTKRTVDGDGKTTLS